MEVKNLEEQIEYTKNEMGKENFDKILKAGLMYINGEKVLNINNFPEGKQIVYEYPNTLKCGKKIIILEDIINSNENKKIYLLFNEETGDWDEIKIPENSYTNIKIIFDGGDIFVLESGEETILFNGKGEFISKLRNLDYLLDGKEGIKIIQEGSYNSKNSGYKKIINGKKEDFNYQDINQIDIEKEGDEFYYIIFFKDDKEIYLNSDLKEIEKNPIEKTEKKKRRKRKRVFKVITNKNSIKKDEDYYSEIHKKGNKSFFINDKGSEIELEKGEDISKIEKSIHFINNEQIFFDGIYVGFINRGAQLKLIDELEGKTLKSINKENFFRLYNDNGKILFDNIIEFYGNKDQNILYFETLEGKKYIKDNENEVLKLNGISINDGLKFDKIEKVNDEIILSFYGNNGKAQNFISKGNKNNFEEINISYNYNGEPDNYISKIGKLESDLKRIIEVRGDNQLLIDNKFSIIDLSKIFGNNRIRNISELKKDKVRVIEHSDGEKIEKSLLDENLNFITVKGTNKFQDTRLVDNSLRVVYIDGNTFIVENNLIVSDSKKKVDILLGQKK